MKEKKVAPARGALLALAISLFVWALLELALVISVPISMARGTYSSVMMPEGIRSVVFGVFLFLVCLVFGIRFLRQAIHQKTVIGEVLLLGILLSVLVFLNQIAIWICQSWITAQNANVTFGWDPALEILSGLINLSLLVLFLLALFLRKASPQPSLVLAIVASSIFAFRGFLGLLFEVTRGASFITLCYGLLPFVVAAFLILVFALALSKEKKEAVAEPLASENESPETK
jgi:hypothetical protein